MPKGTLADAKDIRLVDENYKTDNWRAAADEIQEFWDDGLRTFVEMADQGEYSRAHYQKVFHEHFEIVRDGGSPSLPTPEDEPSDYNEIFKSGFTAGLEYAKENPELLGLTEQE